MRCDAIDSLMRLPHKQVAVLPRAKQLDNGGAGAKPVQPPARQVGTVARQDTTHPDSSASLIAGGISVAPGFGLDQCGLGPFRWMARDLGGSWRVLRVPWMTNRWCPPRLPSNCSPLVARTLPMLVCLRPCLGTKGKGARCGASVARGSKESGRWVEAFELIGHRIGHIFERTTLVDWPSAW